MDELVHRQFTSYANGFLAGRNVVIDDVVEVTVGKAIQRAYVNLEQRYRTYSEGSWCAEVLTSFAPENQGKLSANEFELMLTREIQIMMEVENAVDCELTAIGYWDNPNYIQVRS